MTGAQTAMERFVAELPKVELHVHLEGSMQPATLLELARRRRVDLPADDEAGLRRWFEFRDFEHFVEVYLTCCRCLRDPEDFQLVLEQFLQEQARQQVLYSEIHFTIGTHLANGVNGGEVADALGEVVEQAPVRYGVRVGIIPDIVRNVGPEWADQTLEWALAGRGKGIVALGLSGFEDSPDEPFREHFREAQREGLHRVAHAGEHAGPDSIRSVLEVCRAERVGHGIRAVDDPDLVSQLVTQGIPLEICASSNLRLGAVADLAVHPFDRLHRAGVVVTINSDDPPLFETDLNREHWSLAQQFGYGPAELARFSFQALDSSFIGESDRRQLNEDLVERLEDLGIRRQGDDFEIDEGLVS